MHDYLVFYDASAAFQSCKQIMTKPAQTILGLKELNLFIGGATPISKRRSKHETGFFGGGSFFGGWGVGMGVCFVWGFFGGGGG